MTLWELRDEPLSRSDSDRGPPLSRAQRLNGSSKSTQLLLLHSHAEVTEIGFCVSRRSVTVSRLSRLRRAEQGTQARAFSGWPGYGSRYPHTHHRGVSRQLSRHDPL
ncbi:hypothetical protein AAFF_G00249020 [Aldrovandia affinis]|uniref:Uncharacterized protein n=1 Tax=Aldrovandia affinis TaxID=143900 RepID=A0AAD7RD08_9TELE|nr:hypothetical protein AAFF_G00249020 [Aldrovandia affinis]